MDSREIAEILAEAEDNQTINRQIVVISRDRDFTLRDLLGVLLDLTRRVERLEAVHGNQEAKAEKDPGQG